MSESKHTPGPWVTSETQKLEGRSGTYRRITERADGMGADIVAHVCVAHPFNHDLNACGEANALLIAAAPALYDAADNALNALIGCCVPAGGVDDRKTMLEAQEMLRSALAAATGEVKE